MGGGDLNLKKSWHPHTMKNMERVWKAEQKDTEEKKRIAELQREIVAERSKEELQKFAEDMGVVKKKDEVKLEWMYKGPSQSINREDYLLGKAVDKNFEKHSNEQSGDFVEEESLPDALRQARSSMFSEQVDVARKLHEDPLMAIRQRAVEKAKQLYNNPVKMKLIQKMAAVKSSDDKMHKIDKKKKKKKGKKSSKSDEKMLDALLTQKLRTALKDRDLLQKLKEKAHESSSGSSNSDKSSESDDDSVSKRHKKQSNDHESVQREESPIRSKDYKSRKYFHDGYKSRESKRYSRSPNFKYHRNSLDQSISSRTSRSRSRDRHNISQKTHGFPSQKASTSRPLRSSSKERQIIKDNSPSFGKAIYEKNRRNVRRDEGSDSSYADSDTDTASSKKRRMFGLMMADGSRPVIKEKPLMKDVKKQQTLEPTKPLHQRREKLKLTNEEKEKRRTEMLENACWRDKEREANVKQYRMEEANEKKQLLENFDTDFSMKQLSKVSSQYSVEGRIKSKLNSIQRSKVAMDQNFARR